MYLTIAAEHAQLTVCLRSLRKRQPGNWSAVTTSTCQTCQFGLCYIRLDVCMCSRVYGFVCMGGFFCSNACANRKSSSEIRWEVCVCLLTRQACTSCIMCNFSELPQWQKCQRKCLTWFSGTNKLRGIDSLKVFVCVSVLISCVQVRYAGIL